MKEDITRETVISKLTSNGGERKRKFVGPILNKLKETVIRLLTFRYKLSHSSHRFFLLVPII